MLQNKAEETQREREEASRSHSLSGRPGGRPGEVARKHSTFVPLFSCLFPGPTINKQLSLNIALLSQPCGILWRQNWGGGGGVMVCGWGPSLGFLHATFPPRGSYSGSLLYFGVREGWGRKGPQR